LNARLPFDAGFARITFIDGQYAAELSSSIPEGSLVVLPLSQALNGYADILQEAVHRSTNTDAGAFAALNAALFRDGALVLAQGEIATPVHVAHVTSDRPGRAVSFPRNVVVAAPTSKLTVIETCISLGDENHFTDAVTDVLLEEGASVDHYHLLLENRSAYHIGRLNVRQGRDTSYRGLVYETGSGLGRLDVQTVFDDTGSTAELRGLYITAGDQHIDNEVSIDHAKPHNTSRLYYKGILDDRSSAVFGGTVFVRPGADKTDAHQEDKNLLLSEDAAVSSKPALEIYADDVKAGHGATAGALADETLFYIQSRGIDADTAMRLVVQGFASEILDAVSVEPLRAWLEADAMHALPRFTGEVTA
jgi:Fe-S cluster assembly protein SufD